MKLLIAYGLSIACSVAIITLINLWANWIKRRRIARMVAEYEEAMSELGDTVAHHNEREALAEYAHEAWQGWIEYMFSKCDTDKDGGMRIPKWAVDRWARQLHTTYGDLSETEKASDRDEADRMLAIVASGPHGGGTE